MFQSPFYRTVAFRFPVDCLGLPEYWLGMTTSHLDELNMRFRSVRAYRRALDKVLREALAGHRPMEDVQKIAAACKAGSELFMAEQLLARAGGDLEAGEHPMGEDGGVDLPHRAQNFRRKKITVKSGVNKHGARVDEKSVQIETGADDREAEGDAEAETF